MLPQDNRVLHQLIEIKVAEVLRGLFAIMMYNKIGKSLAWGMDGSNKVVMLTKDTNMLYKSPPAEETGGEVSGCVVRHPVIFSSWGIHSTTNSPIAILVADRI